MSTSPVGRHPGRATTHTRERKLAAYAVVSGAFLASADQAQAGIVYSGIRDVPIGNQQTVGLNVNDTGPLADTIEDYRLRQTNTISGLNQTLTLSILTDASNQVVLNSGGFAAALNAGDLISSADTWGSGTDVMASYKFKLGTLQSSSGPWVGTQNRYLGLYFEIPGDGFHYGWARVDLTGDQSAEGTLVDWAYETRTDAAIVAGAVPEPSSLTLGALALGAVGVAALVRSRRQGRPG